MAQLRNTQTAMFLRDAHDLSECRNAPVVVIGQDGVAVGFDGVVGCHCVAGDDYADLAFAPDAVEVCVGWGWVAAVGLTTLDAVLGARVKGYNIRCPRPCPRRSTYRDALSWGL